MLLHLESGLAAPGGGRKIEVKLTPGHPKSDGLKRRVQECIFDAVAPKPEASIEEIRYHEDCRRNSIHGKNWLSNLEEITETVINGNGTGIGRESVARI